MSNFQYYFLLKKYTSIKALHKQFKISSNTSNIEETKEQRRFNLIDDRIDD